MKDDIAEVLAGNRRWAVVQSDVIDFLKSLPDGCIHTCVTSPPYFQLRDYGVAGQIGLEPTPEAFITALVEVFREVHRVLHPSGTLWVNIGDSYNTSDKWDGGGGNTGKQTIAEGGTVPSWEATRKRKPKIDGVKPKDLIGIPWLLAFALRADGWYLRQDVIWHKPSPMPSSVKDRCTTAHEYLFLLSKEPRYYFDSEAISEPAVSAGKPIPRTGGWADGPGSHSAIDHNQSGRQSGYRKTGELCGETRAKRSVWRVASKPFKGAHFACVDDETEALTRSGWKRQSELMDGDEILAYDLEADRMAWQVATFHRYPFAGEMVAIDKRDTVAATNTEPQVPCPQESQEGAQS